MMEKGVGEEECGGRKEVKRRETDQTRPFVYLLRFCKNEISKAVGLQKSVMKVDSCCFGARLYSKHSL